MKKEVDWSQLSTEEWCNLSREDFLNHYAQNRVKYIFTKHKITNPKILKDYEEWAAEAESDFGTGEWWYNLSRADFSKHYSQNKFKYEVNKCKIDDPTVLKNYEEWAAEVEKNEKRGEVCAEVVIGFMRWFVLPVFLLTGKFLVSLLP